MLYASQWFLTCFSCPFPAKFACRVIDVLLQEQQPHVLLRVALAVVAECEADILELHDFEDIITFLKALSAILMASLTACMLLHTERSSDMMLCHGCLAEGVLTGQSHAQVEPVKWSPQRMRKVLNNAILSGNVADDMIACAEQALGEGFEGSLSR